MLFSSSDAPLLVVILLLCIIEPDSANAADTTAGKINNNLPQCCLSATHIQNICEYLYFKMPDWLTHVMALDLDEDLFLAMDFLHRGLLAGYELPPDDITTEGLLRTMRRIVSFARGHPATSSDLATLRFDPVEGDELGSSPNS